MASCSSLLSVISHGIKMFLEGERQMDLRQTAKHIYTAKASFPKENRQDVNMTHRNLMHAFSSMPFALTPGKHMSLY